MIPDQVSIWLTEHGYGEITSSQPVGGGCINNGIRLKTSSGAGFFLKTNANCPEDMFAREADGLRALAVLDGPRVPQTFLHGPGFLLLEDLAPAPRRKDYWPEFGRKMAVLHTSTADKFGFEHDNYIGSGTQVNTWTADGYQFYARHRLTAQGETAANNGLLKRSELTVLEEIAARLPELVPEQPPALLHGDLWSGNQIADSDGNPAIIDPAVYFGWAEADLAMMTLFGSPGSGFWEGYSEVRPLAPGYHERFQLYNLYHLLNHLNLSGRSYHGQVLQTLKRFA